MPAVHGALPAFAPNVLVANPSLPATDVKALAALVKANPGKYAFASAGMGTTPYLSGELFKLSLGADLVHVPFNGSAPAIPIDARRPHAVRLRRARTGGRRSRRSGKASCARSRS